MIDIRFNTLVEHDLLYAYEIHLFSRSILAFFALAKEFLKLKINVYSIIDIYAFFLSFQANGDASLGKYVAGSVSGASGDSGLFVANHAY